MSRLIKDPKVQELAKKNDMGIGQLLQSWAVQRGTVPLGKSVIFTLEEGLTEVLVLERPRRSHGGDFAKVTLGFVHMRAALRRCAEPSGPRSAKVDRCMLTTRSDGIVSSLDRSTKVLDTQNERGRRPVQSRWGSEGLFAMS